MNLLLLVLLYPRRAAESMKATPRWIIPFVILAGASVATALLQHPHIVRLTLDHLPASATVEDKLILEQSLNEGLAVRCAFLPIRLLIGWASFALILLYTCKAWSTSGTVRIRQVFCLEVAAEGVMVLGQISSLIYPNGDNESFVRIPFGADMLLSLSHDVVLQMTWNSVNIFSIWYIVILTLGISIFYGITTV